MFSETLPQRKNPQIWQVPGELNWPYWASCSVKRTYQNMTSNSLTKCIKVVCADMGFVFIGGFPKKSQNPKLKQEIQGIS